MKRLLALFILFASLRALAQTPVIRAHLEPSSNIMVGQPVRLVVSVFVPNYFTGSPEFPEFEIENAIIVLPQDRPQNSNMQIGNATYFGITQTYVIYPQQEGDFHVPPAKLSVPYAIAPPKSTIAEVALPALNFHADIPAAARDLPYFLPTTRLTITERWSHPLKGLRTGDTVERTITVTASKMQAMLIPPLELEQPDGLHIYNGEPMVRDKKTDRGDFIYGQRIQTAKYFIEKPGNYALPPIELKWWNLSIRRLATAVLPETKFIAVINSDYKAELPPPPEVATQKVPIQHHLWQQRRTLEIGLSKIILILILLFLLQRLIRQSWPHIKAWRTTPKYLETACFGQLLHAARRNDANATYGNLLRWIKLVFPGASLHDAMTLHADDDLRKEIANLAHALFSGHSPTASSWEGDKLAKSLRVLRDNRFKSGKLDHQKYELSALNP